MKVDFTHNTINKFTIGEMLEIKNSDKIRNSEIVLETKAELKK